MKFEYVIMYADTTGLFTDEQCDIDNLVEIKFPVDILRKWYEENDLARQTAYEPCRPIEQVTFDDWLIEASTADDTIGLYDFSVKNGFTPGIKDVRTTYVFYRDDCNFKTIVFEGRISECRHFCTENGWEMDGNELEIA